MDGPACVLVALMGHRALPTAFAMLSVCFRFFFFLFFVLLCIRFGDGFEVYVLSLLFRLRRACVLYVNIYLSRWVGCMRCGSGLFVS